MDFVFTAELHIQPTQSSMDDSFFPPPPLFADDFGITAENVDRLAEELDLELLNEFFGSSLGEDVAKYAHADDAESSSKPALSTPPPPIVVPSPPAPTSSMPSTASSSPSMPSTSAPVSGNSRKRKATQDRSCVNCKTHESSMWRRDPEGRSLCNACGQHFYKFKVHRPEAMFNRPIKKRCRKVKDDAPTVASTQFVPDCYYNVGMAWQLQQPQQQIPPAYPYQQYQQPQPQLPMQSFHQLPQIPPLYQHQPQPLQPQIPMPSFHQPPPMPEVYYPCNNWQSQPSYPLPPYFQQGQW